MLEELLEQALVKDEDKPYDVPGNWVWTKIGRLCDVRDGTHDSPKYVTEGVPLVTSKTLKNGKLNLEDINLISVEDHINISKRSKVNSGDILFAMIGTIGNPVLIDEMENQFSIKNVALFKKSQSVLNSKYLFYYLQTNSYMQQLGKKLKGSTQKFIALGNLRESLICFPPLKEQQRIVDIIESLFEKLDRAKELAQHALDSFADRKSAILHKAFKGELTRKWREENKIDCGDDIVEELYNYRIGLAKTSVERDKVEIIFKYQEHQDNGKLPAFWRYVTLEKLCKSFQYGTSKRSDNQGEVVVLRMGNLQSGKIDWSNLAYTSVEEDIIKYSLKNGDVLFNRTNSPELVGKTSIYEGERPAIFAGYLIRINNLKHLDSYYLNYVMNTSFAKAYCMNVKSDGVNQSNINAQKLAKFEIPFCSLKEQKEIVRILDNLLANEQKAKELCNVIDKIDHMKKAILARAFRGELGTNNPDEESALELLKEVLKEKI